MSLPFTQSMSAYEEMLLSHPVALTQQQLSCLEQHQLLECQSPSGKKEDAQQVPLGMEWGIQEQASQLQQNIPLQQSLPPAVVPANGQADFFTAACSGVFGSVMMNMPIQAGALNPSIGHFPQVGPFSGSGIVYTSAADATGTKSTTGPGAIKPRKTTPPKSHKEQPRELVRAICKINWESIFNEHFVMPKRNPDAVKYRALACKHFMATCAPTTPERLNDMLYEKLSDCVFPIGDSLEKTLIDLCA